MLIEYKLTIRIYFKFINHYFCTIDFLFKVVS